jgi:quinol-cytochrome oxidoreductase complex cytochrome b subunit
MTASATRPGFKNPIIRWIDHRLPVFTYLDHELNEYPTPKNLNYMWNFGSLAGFMLVAMIATGIILAMHYTPDAALAFNSVEHIMRDVNYGWMLRYIHMNGATMFFIVVYIHIFRGLYYGSYKAPRELLWLLGVLIYVLMMATAFMGYVLPWGQMSFWGATVITNLFSAIPVVGESVGTWLWGGFAVDNPTLNRFFSLHYLLPFVIVGVVILHIIALHRFGSNNPLGIDMKGKQDSIPFHPYYTVKDSFGLGVFLIFFACIVFFWPNLFGEPDNYIPANPLATPAEIVPEWYFLPFYAILRSIPNKLAGVIAMFGAIVLLALVPWFDRSPVKSARFRPLYRYFFWLLLGDCFLLGFCGAHPPEGWYVVASRLGALYYYVHFLVIFPLLALFERPLPLPRSISESVLKPGAMTGAAAPARALPMEKA